MGFLKNIRLKWHDRSVQKAIQNDRINRAAVPLDKAQTIGILFDGTLLTTRETVQNFARKLKKQGKNVKMLAYIDGDQQAGDFVFDHFNKKQVDWLFRPKSEEVETFRKQSFDILINLGTTGFRPLEYIAALSNAGFRVGPVTDQTSCYELMIDSKESTDNTIDFLNQVTFFLNKMNQNEPTKI